MILDIIELRIEKKRRKKIWIFFFENVVSDLWGKKVYVSTKVLLEKRSKTKND